MSVASRRRRDAPEIVQTSWLDCGPAALTSILRGLGASAAYDEVRTLCNTGVDGTSIDTLESVALSAGVTATQMVLPVEQLLAVPENYLPGIIVTMLPDGFAHFVVIWRAGLGRVSLMDPASGRKRQSRRRFMSDLYLHEMEVSAEAWRDWASGEDFCEGLLRRCVSLGVSRAGAVDLLELALLDPGPRGLASLDAALRSEERKTSRARGTTSRVQDRLRHAVGTRGIDLADEFWSCVIPRAEVPESVVLRGAVVLSTTSWDPVAASETVRAQLETEEPSPLITIREALRRTRWLTLAVLLAAIVTALAQSAELLAFQSQLGVRPLSPAWVVAIVLGSSIALGVTTAGAFRVGRHLDGHVRGAWLRASIRLPTAFLRTRPVSDIVLRSHATHRLRDFPQRAARLAVAALGAAASATILFVAAPEAALATAVLLLVSVALPWAFLPALIQADLRAHTLSGCLARPVTDALLGAQTLRQNKAGVSLLAEHDALAATWERAVRRLTLVTSLSRGVTGVVASGALAWCLSLVVASTVELTLLALVLGIVIIDAGSVCAQILQSFPSVRSTLLRQSAPLNAAVADRRYPSTSGSDDDAVVLDGATVRRGSVEMLDDICVRIPKGAHVAVVGPSGSGKSTFLSVVMGATELTDGTIHRSADVHRGGVAWAAPAAWLWRGTVRSNVEFASTSSAASVESRLALTRAADSGRFELREVGEGGALLSDGEAQRVRLARALGRPDAPLVVLDEAMRGLPRDERASVLSTVRGVWANSTVICALHEIADASTFDLAIVLDGGRLVEVGTPPTLLADPDSHLRAMLDAAVRPIDGWRRIDLSRVDPTRVAQSVPSSLGSEPNRGHV